ncbi:MAG: hypothetical protein K1X89_31285, partial [Myxococcaceae bacterium]|nr:hypothetical protein [Myxococcaceae bacterium]
TPASTTASAAPALPTVVSPERAAKPGPPPDAEHLRPAGPHQIRITSTLRGVPARAGVMLAGHLLGTTPLYFDRAPGLYRAKLVSPGLPPVELELLVTRDQGGAVEVELDPETF